ncbi:MAG: hypothetical protein AAF153_00205 [Pseudomonadota bacterium]
MSQTTLLAATNSREDLGEEFFDCLEAEINSVIPPQDYYNCNPWQETFWHYFFKGLEILMQAAICFAAINFVFTAAPVLACGLIITELTKIVVSGAVGVCINEVKKRFKKHDESNDSSDKIVYSQSFVKTEILRVPQANHTH